MKLKLLSACVLVGMAFASQQAFASDGLISVTGTIQASTCTSIAGTSGTNVDVTLPVVAASALASSGQTAGTTPFQIALSGCPTTGSAHAFFEPGSTTTDMTTGNLKNTGLATNVQVQLLNDDLSVIRVNQPDLSQNSLPVSLATGSATLKYRAQYYATGTAVAGSVNSSVYYTIVYN